MKAAESEVFRKRDTSIIILYGHSVICTGTHTCSKHALIMCKLIMYNSTLHAVREHESDGGIGRLRYTIHMHAPVLLNLITHLVSNKVLFSLISWL